MESEIGGSWVSKVIWMSEKLELELLYSSHTVSSGNMYGWDVSGNYPGLMSGYSRHLLGWLDVVDITFSQQVTIISACDSNKIYRITHRMASDEFGEEYLLMENRQACGHDVKLSHDGLDRQGIVIWHVDHTGLLGEVDGQDVIRFNTAKAPNSPEWPKIHSRVAILQGDGNFDLENNVNRGDDFDSFRIQAGAPSIAKMISSEGVTMNDGTVKKYPNTNSIAYGEERETGIIIEILDSPQNDMRVKVTLLDTNGLSVAVAAAEESTETPVAKPAETKVDTPPAQLEAEDETPPTESETPEQDQNAGTSSITQIGGSTASVFNQFSFSGGSNANNSTEAPADAPSDAPAATLTEAPQATVETQSEMYTCDNSEYEEFEVSGVGETPSMNTIKQCQFIKPEKRNPAEWCNALDLWNNNQPVYMKCQRECNTITGCPASVKNETSVVQSQTTVVLPTEAPATSSTDVSIAPVATPTDATVSDPTDTPVVSPTESPVALQKNDVPAPAPTDMPDPLATEHSVPAVTELPVAPEMEDDVISAPTEAPTILATQPPPPVVNSSVAPPTEAPVVPLTEAPITLTTEAPLTTESTQSEAYSCDNSKYEEFEVTGLGETPTMNIIKQCQFIQPDKRDPTEWCNALDMWNNNQPVYHKCQRECNVITGCPPPEPDETRRHLRH